MTATTPAVAQPADITAGNAVIDLVRTFGDAVCEAHKDYPQAGVRAAIQAEAAAYAAVCDAVMGLAALAHPRTYEEVAS